MKNIMTALAVVAFAAAAQAASVDWTLSSKNTFMKQDGTAAKGMTVYLLNTAATDYAKLVADLGTGAATAANVTSYGAYLGSATTGSTATGAGKVTTQTATQASIVAGANVYGQYLVFDTVGTDKYYYLSASATGKGYDGSAEYPTGTPLGWSSTTYASDNWTKVAGGGDTPEPTSGLLLLLGVAGLALRRKQA